MTDSDFLYDFHEPQEVLGCLKKIADQRKSAHFADSKDLREAWVLANFCSTFPSGEKPRLQLIREEFPDEEVLFGAGNPTEAYEITDAFENGTGRPDKDSCIFGKVVNGGLTSTGWNTDILFAVIDNAIKIALKRKKFKHYSAKVNLLIYLRDTSTFGEWEKITKRLGDQCNPRKLSAFKSVNILSSDGCQAYSLPIPSLS